MSDERAGRHFHRGDTLDPVPGILALMEREGMRGKEKKKKKQRKRKRNGDEEK
jgi:hypothetical protein